MEGYTLKPGDELKVAGHVLVVGPDGVARRIDRADIASVPAGTLVNRVDMSLASVPDGHGGMVAAAQMIRAFANQVSFAAEPPKPKTPKPTVIDVPNESLKARRKQLAQILRKRSR